MSRLDVFTTSDFIMLHGCAFECELGYLRQSWAVDSSVEAEVGARLAPLAEGAGITDAAAQLEGLDELPVK
jgi:hypothetical protein